MPPAHAGNRKTRTGRVLKPAFADNGVMIAGAFPAMWHGAIYFHHQGCKLSGQSWRKLPCVPDTSLPGPHSACSLDGLRLKAATPRRQTVYRHRLVGQQSASRDEPSDAGEKIVAVPDYCATASLSERGFFHSLLSVSVRKASGNYTNKHPKHDGQVSTAMVPVPRVCLPSYECCGHINSQQASSKK